MDNITYGEIGKPIKLEKSEAHTTSVPFQKRILYTHANKRTTKTLQQQQKIGKKLPIFSFNNRDSQEMRSLQSELLPINPQTIRI